LLCLWGRSGAGKTNGLAEIKAVMAGLESEMQNPTIHAIVQVMQSGVELGQIAVILVDPGSRCAFWTISEKLGPVWTERPWKTN